MRQRSRWFGPSWRTLIHELTFPLLLFTLQPVVRLILKREFDLVAELESTSIALSVAGIIGWIVLSERLSEAGVHQFGTGIIRWMDVVSAVREGSILRYEAAIGAGGHPVQRSLRINPGVEDSIRSWTPESHPFRRALDGSAA